MRRSPLVRVWSLVRAGAVDLNPQTFVQRSGTFASAAKDLGAVSLVLTRTAAGMRSYLVAPDGDGADSAALHLAHAVGARADETGDLPDLATVGHVTRMVLDPGSGRARASQSGVDPAELSRLMASAMPVGSWVGATLRPATRGETRGWDRWLSHRLGVASPVHHSMSSCAVLASVHVGAGSRAQARSLLNQVAGALPGFDLGVRAHSPSRLNGSPWLAAVAVAAAATLWAGGERVAAAALAALGVVAAVVVGVWAPNPARRLAAAAGSLRLPAAPRRILAARPPRRATETAVAVEGDYPLHPRGFLVGPEVVVGLVAPQAGAMSGQSTTSGRVASRLMLQDIGPIIGDTTAGEAVHVSAAEGLFGVGVVGVPGSGKSVLTRSLFAFACLERTRPCGRPGWPGRRNAVVAFESKGEGAGRYLEWARVLGDRCLLVDLADEASWAVDLFAVPGTTAQRAQFFTGAMVYAFEAGAIQDRSYETLVSVFTAALAVTDRVVAAAGNPDLPAGASVVTYAHLLLGGRGEALGVALAGALRAEAIRRAAAGEADPDLDAARLALEPLYGAGKSESARRTLTEAPRNKVFQLLAVDHWFAPGRRKITWDQVLTGHRAVVVNMGSSAGGGMVEDLLSARMSSLLMFSLRHAVMRLCSGWLEQGRFVSIFADELSLLAGSSPEVITWLRMQGRSYGVRPVLATQHPDQLSDPVRTALLSFSTLLVFRQINRDISEQLARELGGDGTVWSGADVANLERYHVIVRADVDQRRQQAFTIRARNFEDDMAAYPAAQGYPTGPAA